MGGSCHFQYELGHHFNQGMNKELFNMGCNYYRLHFYSKQIYPNMDSSSFTNMWKWNLSWGGGSYQDLFQFYCIKLLIEVLEGQSTRWYFDLDHGEWQKVFLLQDVLVNGNFAIFAICSPFNTPFSWFTNLNAFLGKENLLVRTFITCDKVDVQHFPCYREFIRKQNDYLNNCPNIYIRIVG